MTGLDLLTAAFQETNILGSGEQLTPEDAEFGLGKLNLIVDGWNTKREAVVCDAILPFVLTPALSPHTIGPLGTWVVAQRPVSIEDLQLVVGTVHTPITLRDKQWYAALSVPSTAGAMPTDCYYEPADPAGRLFFYPVPSAAYTVKVWTRVVLLAFDLTATITLPPGYRKAYTLTLAEDLAGAYPGAVVSPKLATDAREARAAIFGNNQGPVRLATRDAGMPGARGGSSFDYRIGGRR